ncbi:MAG: orotidine-5'-phosphate decarboxylase [Gammaproteobacteria bacterium]|nr:orotidine-5'-phosphate decarboxylase [Gammaproteobacteria bacterium]
MHDSKIIVALDFASSGEALSFARRMNPQQCRLKVGKELFTLAGPDVVRQLQSLGFDIFLDLKFHDIPATVARACAVAADIGVWMLNVHALGGEKMMREAANAVAGSKTQLIAVTVLTSMDAQDLAQVGIAQSVDEQVSRLATLAKQSGMHGVVCSAREASLLRETCGDDFLKVTPGIRPAWAGSDDQKRIVTPAQALKDGASHLVIGRPITRADNPQQALEKVLLEINEC